MDALSLIADGIAKVTAARADYEKSRLAYRTAADALRALLEELHAMESKDNPTSPPRLSADTISAQRSIDGEFF
jgi:hypothetical protein